MATSKKSSTSKTARVMNLLSKSRDEAVEAPVTPAEEPVAPVEAPTAAPAAPASAPAPTPHAATPALISSMQADSAISDQVMTALESAFENELGEQSAPVEAEPATTAEPEVTTEAETAEEPTVAAAVEVEPTPAAETVVEVSAAETELPPIDIKEDKSLLTVPPTQFHVDAATIYVNVMETLVEDKANKYIDLFGLCKCPRCVADVKALALNRLEPKYVVMKKGDVIPRITLYESQFSAAVTSHLLTACKMVMEHPRHDR